MPVPKRLPVRPVRPADYEDPSDRLLRSTVRLAWPVPLLARLFVQHLGEPWLSGKLTGKGVKVGPRRLRDLDRPCRLAAEVLGVRPPELFLTRDTTVEMTLLGTESRSTLAVTSTLLESVEEDELFYLLGRQMGHIRSGHVELLTLMRWLKDALGSALKRLAMPATLVLQRWQRAATFSADRAGLIATQDLHSSCQALLRVALGRRGSLSPLEIEEYTRQGLRDLLRHPLKSAPELLEPIPALPRRIAGLYEFRTGPRYAELFPPDSPSSIA
jgi:Zn-dependent protease with chaperone function